MTWSTGLWGLLLVLITAVVTNLVTIWVLVRLPTTYFRDPPPPAFWAGRHPSLRWTGLIGRNLVGALVVGVGIVLSLPGVPGPGLLLLLIGIMLLDFPGKRGLERRLVGRPRVLRAINWLRGRFARPSLVLDREPPQSLELGPAGERMSPVRSPDAGHDSLNKVLARRLLVGEHELKVFVESAPLIAAMIADIQTATTRVWLESYIFAGDGAGQAIAEALMERARAGVGVRVLYDAVGSFSTPSALFEQMQAAGVQVHAYHTLWEAFWQLAILRILNRRNHRKLLIIDERVAYFGGMNIVDQQEAAKGEPTQAEQLLQSAGCRDVHVRLVGPRQADLADNMDRLWRRLHKQPNDPEPSTWCRHLPLSCEEPLYFFDSSPGFKHSCAARVFTQLICRAKRSIILSMAYFIPVGRILRELVRASRRGVLIQVIVPGQSDVNLVQRASRHCYARLLRHGIQVYERQDKMLHGKVMIVDDQWTLVGSCNLDPRSLWINREFFAVIRSRTMAAVIRQVCAYERRYSRPVTIADCWQRSWWQRLLDGTAWSFRWWL